MKPLGTTRKHSGALGSSHKVGSCGDNSFFKYCGGSWQTVRCSRIFARSWGRSGWLQVLPSMVKAFNLHCLLLSSIFPYLLLVWLYTLTASCYLLFLFSRPLWPGNAWSRSPSAPRLASRGEPRLSTESLVFQRVSSPDNLCKLTSSSNPGRVREHSGAQHFFHSQASLEGPSLHLFLPPPLLFSRTFYTRRKIWKKLVEPGKKRKKLGAALRKEIKGSLLLQLLKHLFSPCFFRRPENSNLRSSAKREKCVEDSQSSVARREIEVEWDCFPRRNRVEETWGRLFFPPCFGSNNWGFWIMSPSPFTFPQLDMFFLPFLARKKQQTKLYQNGMKSLKQEALLVISVAKK